MTSRSFPVGWVPEAAYPEKRLALKPGDRLYLYSDGIPEARNAGREQFGERRIVETVSELRGARLRESLNGLVAAADAWSEQPLDDDVSALAIEVK